MGLGSASGSRSLVEPPYVPQRGDFVSVVLTTPDRLGHEQNGKRPGLVLTTADFNRKLGLAIICPVTSAVKGFPFELPVPPGLAVSGVVLLDQIRTVDWRTRSVQLLAQASPEFVDQILRVVRSILS